MPGSDCWHSWRVHIPSAPHASSADLRRQFGDIDIYLFDQLLKGRFDGAARILDAGCGNGRNLVYFLRSGYEIFAVDHDPGAIAAVRALAAALAPGTPEERFRIATVDAQPWNDGQMDVVLSSAVLHFAADEPHFARMVRELFRVLRPGGFFFARLASTIGLEAVLGPVGGHRARLPDGTERFLVDEDLLLRYARELGAELAEPLKTTNVQNMRAMTTWCLMKAG